MSLAGKCIRALIRERDKPDDEQSPEAKAASMILGGAVAGSYNAAWQPPAPK